MKKGEDTSMVTKRLSGQDLGYPCAITRRYTSSTQSRDALRVHPRTRHPLTPPLLFPSSHHPFPVVLSLPPPTNSYNYVHVPIYNPPSIEQSTARFPMFRYRVFLFPSLSFLLVSRKTREKFGDRIDIFISL